MSEEIELAGIKVPKADWEATPASIQALVLVLSERLQQQDERIRQFEERLNQNSQNSSKPPSSDGFGQSLKPKKSPKRPSRGPSKSSPRQMRKLVPSEACDQIQDVLPSVCSDCGAPLTREDPHPHRHQEMEVPPIEPLVVEYRLHQLACQVCGHQTRASLPPGVSPSGYGARLSAIVALLSGSYRHVNKRLVRGQPLARYRGAFAR